MNSRDQVNRANHVGMVLYDIGDAIFFLGHHTQVTGIQRVVLAFIEAIKKSDNDQVPYRFIAFSQSIGTYVILDNESTHNMFDLLKSQGNTQKTMGHFNKMAHGDYSRIKGYPIDFSEFRGVKLCILGAAWMFDSMPVLRWAKVEFQLTICCMIYDIIPIRYPQYVTVDLQRTFTQYLQKMSDITDVFLTISTYIASELSDYLSVNGLRVPAIEALQLSTFESSNLGTKRSIRELVGSRRYVLYVSTIEIRKNHQALFDIWSEFARDEHDFPDLVFVGRLGWKVEKLISDFAATHHLDGRLHVLTDVSDAELIQLYKHAHFLAYPSFCEGWGLPVTEALSLGTPVLCSNTTSLPEAGQGVASYLAPHDQAAWKSTVREWCLDHDLRSRFDFTRFKLYTWETILRDLLQAIERSPDLNERSPTLRSRQVIRFGDEASPDIVAIVKLGMYAQHNQIQESVGEVRYGPNWSFRESWGHWALRGTMRLNFRPSRLDGREVILLFLRLPSVLIGAKFVISCNRRREILTIVTAQTTLCLKLDPKYVSSEDNNHVEISLLDKNLLLSMEALDSRVPTIGLEAITIASLDDVPLWTSLSAKARIIGRDIDWAFA